jgi:hypothetical protein
MLIRFVRIVFNRNDWSICVNLLARCSTLQCFSKPEVPHWFSPIKLDTDMSRDALQLTSLRRRHYIWTFLHHGLCQNILLIEMSSCPVEFATTNSLCLRTAEEHWSFQLRLPDSPFRNARNGDFASTSIQLSTSIIAIILCQIHPYRHSPMEQFHTVAITSLGFS